MYSNIKRNMLLRKSLLSNFSFSVCVPCRNSAKGVNRLVSIQKFENFYNLKFYKKQIILNSLKNAEMATGANKNLQNSRTDRNFNSIFTINNEALDNYTKEKIQVLRKPYPLDSNNVNKLGEEYGLKTKNSFVNLEQNSQNSRTSTNNNLVDFNANTNTFSNPGNLNYFENLNFVIKSDGSRRVVTCSKFTVNPKDVLNRFFQKTSTYFNYSEITPTIEYQFVSNNLWMCIYKLNWPRATEISAVSYSKKDASHQAANSVVNWLIKLNAIDSNGMPILSNITNTVLKPSYPLFTNIKENVLLHNAKVVQSIQSTRRRILENQTGSISVLSSAACNSTIFKPPSRLFTNALANLKETSTQQNTKLAESAARNSTIFKPPSRLFSTALANFKENSTQPSTKLAENTDEIRGRMIESDLLINEIKKQFPAPKNVLHNFFHVLANELKQKDLQLIPKYKLVKHKAGVSSWLCYYQLKWPEEIEISKSGQTKQEASHRASLSVLAWLKEKNKITSKGMPLIYDKQELKNIVKTNIPTFSLKNDVKACLEDISYIYENKFPSFVEENDIVDTTEIENHIKLMEPDEIKLIKPFRQDYLGLNQYLAKENVKLPISDYKNEFMDLLSKNRVIIVKGEPGCGKSTRIPQYILEAWAKEEGLDGEPCRIAVTQPRRIAAISLAERVASERSEPVGFIVGYHVRLKSDFNKKTGRVLYCTTGILLRLIQTDSKLSNFTHIVLDEAHERDVNTDLLMNLLRYSLDVNPNLKLIVMSATIDTTMFQDYFENSKIMHVPGFTYPVETHFLNENRLDLNKTINMCEDKNPYVVHEDVVKLIDFIHHKRDEGAILCFLPGWEDISKIKSLLPLRRDMRVLCLHSRLQDQEQRLIFSKFPPGIRKVILATNIAETSVTIDDVVYVIDTGIHKENRFDAEKGVTCIDNYWISKASMKQRKGRAGRCQAGESFHLYPDTKYNEFPKYSLPEILRTSLTKIVLDSKVYSNNMNAIEFLSQLPSPPENSAIKRAVDELKSLELLDENENVTPLGRTLSDFQLEPKLSKAMVNSVIFKCVTPVVDIVTLFSSDSELFASGLIDKEGVKRIKEKYSKNSDHIALMRILEQWMEYNDNEDRIMMDNFCRQNNILSHKLFTIGKLRGIHFDYLYKGLSDVLPIADNYSDNDELVKAVLLSGVGTVLQHRSWDIVKGRLKNTNVLLTRHNQKATITTESINSRKGKFPSDFLLYINETVSNIRRTTIIRETSIISLLSVLLFKNNKLLIVDVPQENFSDKLNSNDQVIIKLLDTKIQLMCSREDAIAILKCKEALTNCMQFYISKLTQKGQPDLEANKQWDNILRHLDQVLQNS